MLLTANSNAGNVAGSFSSFDIDHLDQYLCLYDSGLVLTVGTNGVAVTGDPGAPLLYRNLEFTVPLNRCDRNIRYYAGGTEGPNHLFFLITTDQAAIGGGKDPMFKWTLTMRFSDA